MQLDEDQVQFLHADLGLVENPKCFYCYESKTGYPILGCKTFSQKALATGLAVCNQNGFKTPCMH